MWGVRRFFFFFFFLGGGRGDDGERIKFYGHVFNATEFAVEH